MVSFYALCAFEIEVFRTICGLAENKCTDLCAPSNLEGGNSCIGFSVLFSSRGHQCLEWKLSKSVSPER